MKLAIKGHPTRGDEVIELLEMLGGHQCGYPKEAKTGYWFIDRCSNIVAYNTLPIHSYGHFTIFTLEEFETKFPYKVGDKVIKDPYIGVREVCEMKWEDNCVKYGIGVGEWFTVQ